MGLRKAIPSFFYVDERSGLPKIFLVFRFSNLPCANRKVAFYGQKLLATKTSNFTHPTPAIAVPDEEESISKTLRALMPVLPFEFYFSIKLYKVCVNCR
jgi:hypothetical protein